MKLLAAAVTTLVVAGVGCTGCHEWPAECTAVSGQFDGLSEDAKITVADDVDEATEGIQLDVAVLAVDQCGQNVDITRATLEQSDSKEIDFQPGPEATLSGNRAEFRGVTLTPGLRVLKAVFFTEREPENPVPVTIKLNVYDANSRPEVVTFKFAGDANDDGKLNATELGSGATPTAEIEIANIEEGRPVEVQDKFSGDVYGTAAVVGTHATVSLDALPDKAAGTYELIAHVTNANGIDNKIVDPLPADPLNDAAFRTLTIDLAAPALTILEPSDTDVLMGPGDDAITDVSGFQLTVSANATPAEDVLPDVTIELTGQEPVVVQHTNGSIFTNLDLPSSGTKAYELKVRIQDAAGNTVEQTRTFTVDYDAPVVDITSPLAANGPYDTFELPLSATVTGVPDGTVVHFFTRPSGTTAKNALADLTVVNGAVSDTVTFPGGNLDLIAEVADEVGNLGSDTEASIDVQGMGCSIAVTAPAGTPALLMSSNDTAPGTANLQFDVTGTSSNCPNQIVEVYVGAETTPMAAGMTDGSGNFSVNLTLEEGGPVALKVQMTDAFGATNAVTSQVSVDLTPPAITFPANNASFNTSVDLQALQAGAQQNFSYNPAAASGTRVDVCATAGAGGTQPCPDGASGWFLLAANVGNATSGFTYPDGAYQLKLVEVVDPANTGFNVSAPINLTVDTVRPTVSSFAFANDMNGDKCLNASESPSGTPTALLTVSESGVTVQLQNATTGANIGSPVGPSSGTSVMVPVAVGTATEADFPLVAIVTDSRGNKNTLATPVTMDSAYALFRLDRVSPSTTIQAPTQNELGLADDADATAANYQLRISAITATDVGTNGVDVSVTNATSPGQRTPNSSGQMTVDVTLPATGTTTHAITVTATDKCGNVGAPATTSVVVDRDAPAISCVAPTNATPYGTYAITTTAQVSGAEGSIVHVYTTVSGNPEVELQSLPAVPPGGTTSASVTYPNGTQDVRMEVADSAGNTSQCTVPNMEVNGVGCSILISSPTGNPAKLNASNDGNPGTTTTYEGVLTGSSSTCAGEQAWLYNGSGSGRVLLAGPVTADTNGNFSFNYALGDGSYTLEVEMDNGAGVLTQAQRNVVVDLSPPVMTNVSPSGSNLFFVAATNSHFFPTTQPGYVADGSPGGDAEVNVGLTVTGGTGGTAVVTYAGTTVGGPVSISSSPQTLSIPTVLPHDSTGSFVIKVTDAGGNVVSQTSAAVVDVVAPDAPVVNQMVASGQERAAKVNLSWGAVYDDGSDSASGTPTGYDVRWTTNAVTQSGITSDADYFSTTQVKAEPLVAGSSTTTVLTVPPLAQYWIAVRAVDEVGNYSAFAAPSPLSNVQSLTLQNPSAVANQFYGYTMTSNGSLDGDAFDDLVVGAQTDAAGVVYVYRGGSTFGTAAPQTITPPASAPAPNDDNAAQGFGADIAVGHVSDSSNDLLVSAPSWSRPNATPSYPAFTGRAFLYFGGSSTVDTGTAIEFRGNAGSQFGRTAQIIEDLNGDSFDDIVFSAHTELSGQGRVYVFFGRPKGDATTIGSWLHLQATNGGFVPASAANMVIEGPLPKAGSSNFFGRNRYGVVSLGDLDGTAGGEFLIPDSYSPVNKVFVMPGEARTTTSPVKTMKTGDLPTPNDALQVLSVPPTTSNTLSNFGVCAAGGANLLGGSASDLLIANGLARTVTIYPDGTAAGYGSAALTISSPATSYFGVSCAVRDLNGDGLADIGVGTNVTTNGSVYLFFNRGGAPSSAFDTQAGNGFAQSILKGTYGMGVAFSVGDFTGDGKLDIAAGDPIDAAGKVFVWH